MPREGSINGAIHVGNNNSVIGGDAQKNTILAHTGVLFLPSKIQYAFKLCLMCPASSTSPTKTLLLLSAKRAHRLLTWETFIYSSQYSCSRILFFFYYTWFISWFFLYVRQVNKMVWISFWFSLDHEELLKHKNIYKYLYNMVIIQKSTYPSTLVLFHTTTVSGFCCVCHVFLPLVSIFGLFPVLGKCDH